MTRTLYSTRVEESRPAVEIRTWSTTGISADLEQQRRGRSIRERLPNAADWVAGIGIMAVIVGAITLLLWITGILLNAVAVP